MNLNAVVVFLSLVIADHQLVQQIECFSAIDNLRTIDRNDFNSGASESVARQHVLVMAFLRTIEIVSELFDNLRRERTFW